SAVEQLPTVDPISVSPEAVEPAITDAPEAEATPGYAAEPPAAGADTFAAPVLETPPPVISETPAPAAGGRRRYGSYDAALPVEIFDEEEKRQHQDARRFARLLVSEIKLYNE